MDKQLRATYKVTASHSSIYSGGPVAISDIGEEGFFCSGDGYNHVDLQTGKIIESVETKGELQAIAFHTETRKLVAVAASHLITTYDVSENKSTLARQWKGHQQPTNDVTFHSSGQYIATANNDRSARVWDVNQGFCTHNFKDHDGLVTLVRFHPIASKMQLFTCCDDGIIRIWDLVSKKCIKLESHMSIPTSLCFSKSGWELISGGRDKVLNVWNLHNNELKKTIPVYESIEDVIRVPEQLEKQLVQMRQKKFKGTPVVTCGDRGVLRVWDSSEKEQIVEEQENPIQTEFRRIFVIGGQTEKIVVTTQSFDFMFYSVNPLGFDHILVGSNSEIIDMKYIEDGNSIAVASNCDQVRLFDTRSMACRVLAGHKDIVLSLDVSNDGSTIVTASKDNSLRIWDTKTSKCIAICSGHTESVGAVAMAKRNSDFCCSGSQDKTLKVWDMAKALKEYEKLGEEVACQALITTKAHDMEINSLAVSPNDQMIASASRDKLVKLWNKSKLSLIGVLRGHKRGVWCVQFSPIDRCVASSSADKTIKIWSLSDFSCLRTFEGHTGSVLKFSFVSRGMQLLSSGSDGLIKLWTIKTNECVNSFEHHDDKVWALATKNDGDQFVSGDGDCIISFWEDHTEVLQEQEQQNRELQLLQEQELSNLLHENKYREAVHIAFQLDQPYKIRSIFTTLLEKEPEALRDIVVDFNDDALEKCLTYIRDWNTSARYSVVAQEVLNLVMRTFPPTKLMKIPNMKVLLQGLISYTDRHYQRVDLLQQKACIIDFTLQRMNILFPIEENEPEQVVKEISMDVDDEEEKSDSEEESESMENESPTKKRSSDGEREEPALKRRKITTSDESEVQPQQSEYPKGLKEGKIKANLAAKKKLLARAQKRRQVAKNK